jgi:DNA-directed RNA polymerase specialized sigma subunit
MFTFLAAKGVEPQDKTENLIDALDTKDLPTDSLTGVSAYSDSATDDPVDPEMEAAAEAKNGESGEEGTEVVGEDAKVAAAEDDQTERQTDQNMEASTEPEAKPTMKQSTRAPNNKAKGKSKVNPTESPSDGESANEEEEDDDDNAEDDDDGDGIEDDNKGNDGKQKRKRKSKNAFLSLDDRLSIIAILRYSAVDGKLERGTAGEIARFHGTNKGAVNRLWQRAQDTSLSLTECAKSRKYLCGQRRKHDREEIQAKIAEMPLENRTSLSKIAQTLGLSKSTLHEVLKDIDIDRKLVVEKTTTGKGRGRKKIKGENEEAVAAETTEAVDLANV